MVVRSSALPRHPVIVQALRFITTQIGNSTPKHHFRNRGIRTNWGHYHMLDRRDFTRLIAGNLLIAVKSQAIFGLSSNPEHCCWKDSVFHVLYLIG